MHWANILRFTDLFRDWLLARQKTYFLIVHVSSTCIKDINVLWQHIVAEWNNSHHNKTEVVKLLKMLQFLTSKFGPSCRYACSGLLSDNRVRVKVRSDRTWRGAVQCGAMRRRAKKNGSKFWFSARHARCEHTQWNQCVITWRRRAARGGAVSCVNAPWVSECLTPNSTHNTLPEKSLWTQLTDNQT